MDLREIRLESVGWIGVTQGTDNWRTVATAAVNAHIPWKAFMFLEQLRT